LQDALNWPCIEEVRVVKTPAKKPDQPKAPTPAQSGEGQAGDASSDSPELSRLKAQNALLEQQAAIAENRKKIIDATLPSGVEPLKGETKIDGDNPIEGQILAYKRWASLLRTLLERSAPCGRSRGGY
jgi:hypothetical protein